MKSVLWRVAKRLSYKQDARCLNINVTAQCRSTMALAITVIQQLPCAAQSDMRTAFDTPKAWIVSESV